MIRFILGGSAVVLATLVARFSGSRVGGIFAAFPAVYLAALLSLALDYRGPELLEMSLHVSQGALVGMLANIIFALVVSRLIIKQGWKQGLVLGLIIWLIIATIIYLTWKLVWA